MAFAPYAAENPTPDATPEAPAEGFDAFVGSSETVFEFGKEVGAWVENLSDLLKLIPNALAALGL